jgi:hypothetical protein
LRKIKKWHLTDSSDLFLRSLNSLLSTMALSKGKKYNLADFSIHFRVFIGQRLPWIFSFCFSSKLHYWFKNIQNIRNRDAISRIPSAPERSYSGRFLSLSLWNEKNCSKVHLFHYVNSSVTVVCVCVSLLQILQIWRQTRRQTLRQRMASWSASRKWGNNGTECIQNLRSFRTGHNELYFDMLRALI